jgi:hypothetical protein
VTTLQPALFIGLGHRGRQVLHQLKRQIRSLHNTLPILHWLTIDLRQNDATATKSLPTGHGSEAMDTDETFWICWPGSDLPPSRPQSYQAFQGQAQEFAAFIRQTLPTMTCYEAITAVEASGFQVADSLELALYIVADLGDPVGSSLAVEVAYQVSEICRQQGREPRCAGVFFLPDASQADAIAEANTYAGLKELDAHLVDPSLWQRQRSSTSSTGMPFSHETSPVFDRGCYLLDTVNEHAYTVPTHVLIEQAAQWLYCMSVLALHKLVDDAFDQRFIRRTVRRKVRAYGSFGLAGYTLPTGDFKDWCAARLGQAMIHQGLLFKDDDGLPTGTVKDFASRNGLRVPDLLSLLREPIADPAVPEDIAQHLQAGRLQELDDRLRGGLRHIREVELPVWQQQVRKRMTALNRQVSNALTQKLRALMQQSPVGGVALAREFLDRLTAEVISQEKALEKEEKQHSIHRHHVIAQASRLSYQLRAAVMRLVPQPVLILAALGGVLLPIVYGLAVIFSIDKQADNSWAQLAWLILIAGVGLAVAHHLWLARREDKKQRIAYIEHLHKRADLEIVPLAAHATSTLYQQVQTTIREFDDGLRHLVNRLDEAAERMAVLELQASESMAAQIRPGPWQSLLKPALMEEIYQHSMGDLETHLPQAVAALPPPSSWSTRSADVLMSQLLAYARDYFESDTSLRASEVLCQQSSPEELSRWLSELLHRSAPQCAFGSITKSQSRVPPQITHTLILNGASDSEPARLFTTLSPEAGVLNSGSDQAVVVVSIRRGLPAFALPRINEYWTAYANTLLQENDASMHTSLQHLFLPEPIPAQPGLPNTPVLFAVALGLGLIRQDATGQFMVDNASEQPVSLGKRKETAAVLLARWSKGARALHRGIRTTISGMGNHAAVDRLQNYLRSAVDLTSWERQAIERFLAARNRRRS